MTSVSLHFKISSNKKALLAYFIICWLYSRKATLGSNSSTYILFLLSVTHLLGTNLCTNFRILSLWNPQYRKINTDNLEWKSWLSKSNHKTSMVLYNIQRSIKNLVETTLIPVWKLACQVTHFLRILPTQVKYTREKNTLFLLLLAWSWPKFSQSNYVH